MRIIAIIVTFNSSKYINKCLKSIKDSLYPIDIVVVDNCSNDSTIDIIQNNFTNVYLIQNKINYGFGVANNIGIKYCLDNKADYIVLINHDVYISPDTIKILISKSRNNIVLSPIHLNGQGNNIDYNFKKYLVQNLENNLIDDLILSKNIGNLYEVDFINAAFWFIPVDVIKMVGGFNPIFNHYGEDVDYCNRLKFYKIKIFVTTETYIFHDRMQFGNINFFKKNQLLRQLQLLFCNPNKNQLIIFDLFKILIQPIKNILLFNFKLVLDQLISLIIFIFSINSILKARHISKNNNDSWIS